MAESPLVNGTSSDAQRISGALDAMLRKFDLTTDQLLPAKVISFDRAKNVATVQPLIMWVDIGDGTHSRPSLAEIPVLSIGGGNFHISFPINPGDLGWIFAADRDLSLFNQGLVETRPPTGRCHSFEDSLFIPDVMRQYTINGEDSSAMVIQSTDGSTRVAIGAGTINMTAPTSVKVTSPIVTFTGDVIMQKTLTVATDVKVAGVSVISHGHISSAPGSRTGGGMIE